MTWCLLSLLAAVPAAAEQHLISTRVHEPPAIDGNSNDAVWERAGKITTRDLVAALDVEIKSVYTSDEVFFLVRFADSQESRDHKNLRWDATQERYHSGPDREDTFVFKRSMETHPVDLSLSANSPYKADIWYWKSNRTDYRRSTTSAHRVLQLPDASPIRATNNHCSAVVRLTKR